MIAVSATAAEAQIKVLVWVFSVMEWVDSAACRVPGVKHARGAVLDRVFGPAEPFDYVSTTAPSSPPPTV